MAPEVGTEAPDFTVKDQSNQDVTLSSFRGDRAVLLVFYPFAFSGICTNELGAVRDDLADFQNDDVQILGISTDHPYALKAWLGQRPTTLTAANCRMALSDRETRAESRAVHPVNKE